MEGHQPVLGGPAGAVGSSNDHLFLPPALVLHVGHSVILGRSSPGPRAAPEVRKNRRRGMGRRSPPHTTTTASPCQSPPRRGDTCCSRSESGRDGRRPAGLPRPAVRGPRRKCGLGRPGRGVASLGAVEAASLGGSAVRVTGVSQEKGAGQGRRGPRRTGKCRALGVVAWEAWAGSPGRRGAPGLAGAQTGRGVPFV